jgi:hypothetical protein
LIISFNYDALELEIQQFKPGFGTKGIEGRLKLQIQNQVNTFMKIE